MLLMAGGAGIALALFGLIDSLPFGWRAMYAIGSLAFLFIPTIGRALPETQRFVRQQERGSSDLPLVAPVIGLARAYPWRIIALGAVVFLGAVAEAPAAFFLPSYLQEEHGWQPSTLTFALFTSGGLGLIGVLLIGALSDRVGRKRLAVMFLVVAPMVAAGFYNASGAILPVLLALTALTSQGVTVSINPLGAELFPTSYRSTATGARTIMSTLGGVLGLALHGVLVTPLDSQWTAITVLLAVALVAPLIAVWLPETNRRNLEDIAPER
jgi:MFS family permease